jgi:hypothetical protein
MVDVDSLGSEAVAFVDAARLASCRFGGDWDTCYIGVLAAIAAMRQ